VEAAWELVRADGLAALAMRDLGARVGMRAQSLYAYFPSKHAIYDAMFAEANHELIRRIKELTPERDPRRELRRHMQVFLDFCVEDPVRYQLLFQRSIPGFEPSPESYALAVQVLEQGRTVLNACGLVNPRALDAWTAVIAGLAAQQNANEPGGDRWVRLADDALAMFLAYYQPAKARGKR